MARITNPLTNTQIDKAKPKDKEYNLVDGDGLYLRIKPNGSKLWLLKYSRPFTKTRTNLSFGSYPDVSLAEARKRRSEAKELLAKDIDPKEHRDEEQRLEREAKYQTLAHVTKSWLKVKRTKVTDSHADGIYRSLELHIFPAMGKLPIDKIKASNTIAVIKPIAAKGSLETVKRLCQRLNEVMTYAVNTGLIDSNPLAGIRQAFEVPQKQHMPTIKPEELPKFMRTLSRASIKLTTRCLIEWQLHTMVRPSEAAGTRWEEIDLDNALWSIPPERMKMGRAHTVPLTKQMLTLLEDMQPMSGHREYVFPADRDPTRHTHEQTANMALKRMGYAGLLVAHGLRSIASTALNEQGFDPDVIESALAHVDSNDVRRAYNRADYLERRKVVMCWWSDFIEQAATGNLSLASSNRGLKVIAN